MAKDLGGGLVEMTAEDLGITPEMRDIISADINQQVGIASRTMEIQKEARMIMEASGATQYITKGFEVRRFIGAGPDGVDVYVTLNSDKVPEQYWDHLEYIARCGRDPRENLPFLS